MARTRRLAAVTGTCLALGGLCASASVAATTTTAPGKTVLVYFVLNEKKILFQIYRTTQGGGSGELTLEKYVLRGDFAKFFVINRGKKQHGFAFLGKKFIVKPGRKAHFSESLLTRGAFPYHSTTDRGKAFKGVFKVY
jgi:hypothetical protein